MLSTGITQLVLLLLFFCSFVPTFKYFLQLVCSYCIKDKWEVHIVRYDIKCLRTRPSLVIFNDNVLKVDNYMAKCTNKRKINNSIHNSIEMVTFLVFSNVFEFFMIHVSVRLSDRSKVTQNKINFVKSCPKCGLNSKLPDHHSTALLTVLSHSLVVHVNH